MLSNEYQELACSTAVFPEFFKFTYPAVGIVDETSELNEKFLSGLHGEELVKEFGDVLWYIAVTAKNAGFDFETVTNQNNLADFEEVIHHVTAAERALPMAWMILTNKLFCAAGRILGVSKKKIRDGLDIFAPNVQKEVLLQLQNCLKYLTALILLTGFSLEHVAIQNNKKLKARQIRGTLHGDGDNR